MTLRNTRESNYPEWYQDVISAADMAEVSCSPGCMVMKPCGYGIWERLQRVLDEKIKETGHENCYFPMSYFQKEAEPCLLTNKKATLDVIYARAY